MQHWIDHWLPHEMYFLQDFLLVTFYYEHFTRFLTNDQWRGLVVFQWHLEDYPQWFYLHCKFHSSKFYNVQVVIWLIMWHVGFACWKTIVHKNCSVEIFDNMNLQIKFEI
jgi:hypothetical protein